MCAPAAGVGQASRTLSIPCRPLPPLSPPLPSPRLRRSARAPDSRSLASMAEAAAITCQPDGQATEDESAGGGKGGRRTRRPQQGSRVVVGDSKAKGLRQRAGARWGRGEEDRVSCPSVRSSHLLQPFPLVLWEK
ncbi:hypothetical protein CDD83_9570 [Cordyceps sp. RAO-2017]|nr:hypothetical protein CDD83_9570 [Cordyceps sp. RAO-2017]